MRSLTCWLGYLRSGQRFCQQRQPKATLGDGARLVVVLARLGIWPDRLVDELAHGLLELAVRVGEIGRVVGLCEPGL